MAVLLIKMRDSADPENGYTKGDVVEVREDDTGFGNKECLPRFLVLKVPGTKTENLYLMDPIIDHEHSAERKIIKKRKYGFDLSLIFEKRISEITNSKEMLIDTYEITAVKEKKIGKQR